MTLNFGTKTFTQVFFHHCILLYIAIYNPKMAPEMLASVTLLFYGTGFVFTVTKGSKVDAFSYFMLFVFLILVLAGIQKLLLGK